MPVARIPWLLAAAMLLASPAAVADDAYLRQEISELEKRISALEQRLGELEGNERWKDAILWQRLKEGMSSDGVMRLLGRAARIEEQVFTTWYYHPSSKLHSYVWFDEGAVLGWEAPQ